MKKMISINKVQLIFSVALLSLSTLNLVSCFIPRQSEKILEQWETGNGSFKIPVTAYSEVGSPVPGAYYVFEAIDKSDKKVKIMTFRHDDPVPINKDGVRFVNERIAYVFMGWMYAVTIDGGKNWSIWNAEKERKDWICCSYWFKDVELKSDGTGKMYVDNYSQGRNEIIILHTTNYGQNWFVSQ